MARDDEFLIDIDTPGSDEPAPRTEKPAQARQPADDTDPTVIAIKQRLADAERERDEALRSREDTARLAQENAQKAERAAHQAVADRLELVKGRKAEATSVIDNVKRQIVAARQSGEADREADLQAQLMRASTRLLQYEDAEAEIEANIARARQQRDVKPETQRPSDPFEAAIATLAPDAQNWLRQHKELVKPNGLDPRLERAHYKALGEGHREGSPDYFASLDVSMGYVKPKESEADVSDEPEDDGVEFIESKPEPKRGMPSAPVSRGTPQRDGKIVGNKVRLTREQVEMAEAMGMTPQDYAVNLVKLTKEGRYPNVYN